MDFYETLKSGALCGKGGSGGGNLFTVGVESGGLDNSTGAEYANSYRLRTDDFITLPAGKYVLVWKSTSSQYSDTLAAFVFLYDTGGTYTGRYSTSEAQTPIFLDISEETQIKVEWKTATGYTSKVLSPDNITNLGLFKM